MEPDVFPTLSLTARAVTFYLLALGMCVGVTLALPDLGAIAALVGLTPTIAVLIMQLVVTRDGWRRTGWTSLGLGRLGRRVWGVAVGLPIGVLVVSEAVVRLTGLTSWQLPSGLEVADLVILLPILFVFSLTEEIGWRGYLSPLMDARNTRAPQLQVGLLHGIWHLPLVFLATDVYLTDGNRWVIVPVFLGVLTVAGSAYGWLRRTTGSVWPATLTHTAFNWTLNVIAVTVLTSNPGSVAALGREAGIATLVALIAATLWLTSRRATGTVTASEPAPVLTRSR
jgi:membrane protease YdiL (CAAX protease family)